MNIDLRPRCKRCNKLHRGKAHAAEFARYAPFCTYHCQQWYATEEAMRHLNKLREVKS